MQGYTAPRRRWARHFIRLVTVYFPGKAAILNIGSHYSSAVRTQPLCQTLCPDTLRLRYRTSLEAQWIRICLPPQIARVQFLVREDSTCLGADKPWARTTEPGHLQQVLCSKRSHAMKPAQCDGQEPPRSAAGDSRMQQEEPGNQTWTDSLNRGTKFRQWSGNMQNPKLNF